MDMGITFVGYLMSLGLVCFIGWIISYDEKSLDSKILSFRNRRNTKWRLIRLTVIVVSISYAAGALLF